MGKRVNMIRVPFNYYWPKVSAVTCITQLGPVLVKDEVADAAIERGFAEPFDPAAKITRATGTKIRARKPRARTAANSRSTGIVDRTDLVAHDSASDSPSVDDTGQ